MSVLKIDKINQTLFNYLLISSGRFAVVYSEPLVYPLPLNSALPGLTSFHNL